MNIASARDDSDGIYSTVRRVQLAFARRWGEPAVTAMIKFLEDSEVARIGKCFGSLSRVRSR